MERERDYSMMITKKNWWLESRSNNQIKGNKHRSIKCKCTNVSTGEILIFDSHKDSDEHFLAVHGATAFAARTGRRLKRQWTVETIKA